MKKLLLLVALFTTIYVTNAEAQEKPAGDPSNMVETYKAKLKPLLMEKVSLTEAEATKALNIHFAYAARLRHSESQPAERRQKEADAVNAAEIKELTSVLGSPEKAKAVGAFFAEQKKQMDKRKASNN